MNINDGLRIEGPKQLSKDMDLYEAIDTSDCDPTHHLYSCVAICRRQWTPGWPALGGTRWLPSADRPGTGRQLAQVEATELASSMFVKNTTLRLAEQSLFESGEAGSSRTSGELFGWQGGKGVIWSPWDNCASAAENKRRYLTPRRLIAHGRLVEFIGGEYLASKDQGVGTTELKWIEKATRYTIGLGCNVDTGEATAQGALSGMRRAAEGLLRLDSLEGCHVLVVGVGKVGLPLSQLLVADGAEVYLYDPELTTRPDSVQRLYERTLAMGGAVDERHLAVLERVFRQGRIIHSEIEALQHPHLQIVSPNGGPTRWLSTSPQGGATRSRAEILAAARARGGSIGLVIGAANYQIPIDEAHRPERLATLRTLHQADVAFVPDPLVSPGGVIAVSHELAESWTALAVNRDADRIVGQSVTEIIRRARQAGGTDAETMYKAFEALIEESRPFRPSSRTEMSAGQTSRHLAQRTGASRAASLGGAGEAS